MNHSQIRDLEVILSFLEKQSINITVSTTQ